MWNMVPEGIRVKSRKGGSHTKQSVYTITPVKVVAVVGLRGRP